MKRSAVPVRGHDEVGYRWVGKPTRRAPNGFVYVRRHGKFILVTASPLQPVEEAGG